MQVGLVTQEPTLFQASVLDNIRCANPEATEEDVVRACRDAFIHDVIRSPAAASAHPSRLSGRRRGIHFAARL